MCKEMSHANTHRRLSYWAVGKKMTLNKKIIWPVRTYFSMYSPRMHLKADHDWACHRLRVLKTMDGNQRLFCTQLFLHLHPAQTWASAITKDQCSWNGQTFPGLTREGRWINEESDVRCHSWTCCPRKSPGEGKKSQRPTLCRSPWGGAGWRVLAGQTLRNCSVTTVKLRWEKIIRSQICIKTFLQDFVLEVENCSHGVYF